MLVESLGINALSRAAGVMDTPDDLDLNVVGMRTLESLVTRLLLRLQKLQGDQVGPSIDAACAFGAFRVSAISGNSSEGGLAALG